MTSKEHILKLEKKLARKAQKILDFELAIPRSALEINKILHWLNKSKDYDIFNEYITSCLGLPIGKEREFWDSEKLVKYDKKINKVTDKYREKIFTACRQIMKDFPLN